MTTNRLVLIATILVLSSIAWFTLGGALTARSNTASQALKAGVESNWGSPLTQQHPTAHILTPHSDNDRKPIHPDSGAASVKLAYEPKRRGLLWHRTYKATFDATYTFSNPTPITQTLYVAFTLPQGARFDDFAFALGGTPSEKVPEQNTLTDTRILAPGESLTLDVAYTANGLDTWRYHFGQTPRIRDFSLTMHTDFLDIDIPVGATSPDERSANGNAMQLLWNYNDVLGAQPLGMAMPSKLNPGPVAARITFFAPVSLLFYFAVLVILGMVRRVDLHPMNYFFLAAGCFAFQLVFAYLVDLIPVYIAFATAAAVSLALVVGYLARVAGRSFARLAAIAQFAYMVLFSLSFFFDGLTGITITTGAVVTLAILMHHTAKTDWSTIFDKPTAPTPPVIPTTQS